MPEHAVARADSLQEGEMKQVTAGETDVLLARVGGAYHAVHAYCTHYGAPLAEGALSGSRLVCPWHHACFDLATGRQLEPPGMDGLPRFETRVEDGEVIVGVPDKPAERRVAEMARRDEQDERTFVVLGAGAAGAYAVEAMREAGFAGRVVMITGEADLPYDRVNCSKEFLQGEVPEADMPLRSPDFYAERDIEVLTGRAVTEADVEAKTLTFEDGEVMNYDQLLVCTGGRVRLLDVPGADLENVHTLRSLRDSRLLREKAKVARRVVIVGSSFIGMEGAWSVGKLGPEVVVVSPEEIPFAKLWGERVGRMIRALHEENGVRFRLGEKVERLEGNGRVERVALAGGDVLEADLVLVGIGVDPATDVLKGAERADDGGLVADERLRVADGLYAAGDVAHVPYDGGRVRIEHWRVACQHGRLAGYNMAGRREPYTSVPFFWSAQHGLGLYYAGHAEGFDRIVYDGEPESHAFIAYYVKDGAVRAALGVNRNREMAAIQELLREGRMPSPARLEGGDVDVVALLRETG